MAIGWLAVVPWKEIIANAPAIVDGAKRLSGLIKKSPSGAEKGAPKDETLEQQVVTLRAKVEQLEAAQASAVEVVQSMAKNAEQVIEALASLKAQATMNFRIIVVLSVGWVVLLALVVWLFTRG